MAYASMSVRLRGARSLLLSDYAAGVAATDVLDKSDLKPVLHGLYGEVGGIMSTVKKHVREGAAYPGFKRAAEEEFGDTLWYLAALCRQLNIRLDDLFHRAASNSDLESVSASSDMILEDPAQTAVLASSNPLDETLFALGRSAAALLESKPKVTAVDEFARNYLGALQAAKLNLADVASANIQKARIG
jgi:hypothetical protein